MFRTPPSVVLATGLALTLACTASARPGNSNGGSTGGSGGADSPFPLDPDGWSVITPSPDSRIVYVSSSMGSDSNDGLSPSTPKRSMTAGYDLLRDGYPDWMVLKRGDTWPSVQYASPSWHKNGRSHAEPTVMASYGTGPRPLILTNIWDGMDLTGSPQPLSHLVIMDIHMIADGYDGTNDNPPAAISIVDGVSDLLIENCQFEKYFQGVVMQQASSYGRPSGISMRRDVIVDCFRIDSRHAQGMFATDTDGLLIEECIMDHNGWREDISGANPDIFRHNMYLTGTNHNVVVRGCITARASEYGIMSRSGGLIQDNLCLDNPCAITVGDDQPGEQGWAGDATVQGNVVMGSRTLGWGIVANDSQALTMTGNIVAHQGPSGLQSVRAILLSQNHTSIEVANNTIYDWQTPGSPYGAMGLMNNATCPGVSRIHDNDIQQPNGGFVISDQNQGIGTVFTQYFSNRYFTSNVSPNQFYLGVTFPTWVAWTHESGASWSALAYPAPNRTIATYMQSLGYTPTVDAFMAQARLQERGHWVTQFTAAAVNSYVRDGFTIGGTTPPPACAADLNADGRVNLLDAIAFQSYFAGGNMLADVNHDSRLNVTDFVQFLTLMAQGCH